ncbi:TIM barrel protein [Cryomorpha ignava]|uniref:TIM barrel protein n=1 Tax=Cryomorpha ignava TaxID=101383 RepID=A0A7K3WP41_9FLAO|nr:TIM barrel protein [Cryomorpha ignava]NEN23433.1 TIM barrel protein [Cryomorpha ignava]
MTVYVSTLAFQTSDVDEVVQMAQDHGLNVEFSSGLPYREDMQTVFAEAPVKRIAHNYFPAPKNPFVINLASADASIRERSVAHCIQGLKLTRAVGATFFAAHAGFCIDPDPNELGRPISYGAIADKEIYWAHFIQSLKTILAEAKKLELDFYIENNVLAGFNYKDEVNPLLCCESADILRMAEAFKGEDHFGLLLDTAHFKVSCGTLGFDVASELERIKPYIRAIHHSDNDGLTDTNDRIDATYWFLPYIRDYRSLPHVLEVKRQSIESIELQLNLLEKYGNS